MRKKAILHSMLFLPEDILEKIFMYSDIVIARQTCKMLNVALPFKNNTITARMQATNRTKTKEYKLMQTLLHKLKSCTLHLKISSAETLTQNMNRLFAAHVLDNIPKNVVSLAIEDAPLPYIPTTPHDQSTCKLEALSLHKCSATFVSTHHMTTFLLLLVLFRLESSPQDSPYAHMHTILIN